MTNPKNKNCWQVQLLSFNLSKRMRFNEICSFLKKGTAGYKKCLDIGTGTGGMAFKIKPFGKRWSYVEKDAVAAKEAAKILNRKIQVSLTELKEKGFDLITVIDTFYYFEKPEKTLRELKELLADNGELLITLTDGGENRLINKIRSKLGLGMELREFAFEDTPTNFKKRLIKEGMKIKYFRHFSYFAAETILILLDLAQRRVQTDKDFSLTTRKRINGKKIILLKIMFPLLWLVSFLDLPLRPFHRGYKFIIVATKQGVAT